MRKSYKINRLINIPILLLLIVGFIIVTSCDKDDDQSPVDKLPPITQNGAQTFGCLINGEAFIPPKIGRNSPRSFYQFVRGAYTFNFSGSTGGGSEMLTIIIGGIDISGLSEGEFILTEEESGNFYGEYLLGGGLELSSATSTNNPGKLIITNFDAENFIISGLFSFTVDDNNGNIIEITEGRFDLNYTN